MAWFKVDDGFYSSRKVLSIPRGIRLECIGLWTTAGAWAAKEMTDGRVPEVVLEEFGAKPEVLNKLVAVGLWKKLDDGIEFHDWREYQPTREEVFERRKKVSENRSKAGQKGAQARWQNHGKTMAKKSLPLAKPNFAIAAASSEVNVSKDKHGKMANAWQSDGKAMAPTQPHPTRKEAKASLGAKKPVSLPKSWVPNKACADFAEQNKLDVLFEAEQFRVHAIANDRKQKNWDASFRLWLGNAVKWSKPAKTKLPSEDWMNR
jgi:hypothetical protein